MGLKKAFLAVAVVALTACGDSTGSGTVNSEDALRSLSRGLGLTGGPFGLSASSLGGGTDLGRIDVTIDGAARSMYALGLRVTYPSGTCLEDIYPIENFESDGCISPPLGVVLALWETRSGSRPPDRMILLAADIGTSDFSLLGTGSPDLTIFPAFGFYLDRGGERFWTSIGGTLTSQVSATNQTCDVPLPPFAASATCNFATFDEAGQITFEEFVDFAPTTPRTVQLVIPRQNISGILQAITAVKPITFPVAAALPLPARGF